MISNRDQLNLNLHVTNEQSEPVTIKKAKNNLRCVVREAKASGYNFDRVTCESCKAFFRRNALKDINQFRCRFSGQCQINTNNRRHCTYCRIKKCLTVGMRKEWIRSEEENALKRIQMERKRRLKENHRPLQMPIARPAGCTNSTISVLSSTDRMRINNVTHCYEHYTGEPSICKYSAPREILFLRLHEFFNRKKPIVINFISYFKHLPEFEQIHVDNQVLLIKQNLRSLLPINYALLKTPIHSQFRYTHIRTIGCLNDTNLHVIYQSLSNSFVQYVASDPIMIKIFLITLFFTVNSQTTDIESIPHDQLTTIQNIQSSYAELLWLYLLERWGETQAVHLLTKLTATYLRLQGTTDLIDPIIRCNADVQHIDSLMKIVLQLP